MFYNQMGDSLLNIKVMTTKVKTELTPAQVVINTYPTFTEIFEYALKNIGGVKGSMTHKFYTSLSEEYRWEAVSDLVDLMLEQQQGRPFHKTYGIKVNKKTGFSSDKTGSAIVYDFMKQEHTVNGDEYLALLKIMSTHWMNYQGFTNEMNDAYLEFKCDLKIYKILD